MIYVCEAAAVMNATNALIESLQTALDSNDVVVSDKLPPQLIMVREKHSNSYDL